MYGRIGGKGNRSKERKSRMEGSEGRRAQDMVKSGEGEAP